jgi:hypothetical protein
VSSVAEEVEVLRGSRSATFKDLLTHRAFARLLAAMSVSSLGDWVGFIAVTAIVATIGGGTPLLAVAGVMIARTLPAFLFGPIAGTLVDRLDRKRLMIVADLARGAMYLSMVFLRELWAIYLLSFAIECLSLLWGPARDASLPNLVPRRQLTNANSLVLLSSYATLPIGGAVVRRPHRRVDLARGPHPRPRRAAGVARPAPGRRDLPVLGEHGRRDRDPHAAQPRDRTPHAVAGVARHEGRHQLPP